MNNDKQATLNWILKYNRTPYPYSPQKAAFKGLEPKQPGYFDGNYFKSLKWKDYQDWDSLDENFKSELIKLWHGDKRIEGIGCNAGFNGEFYLSMIDVDPKNFESLEMMEQAVTGWENRNPGTSLCPRVKTQSGGYRYFIGFESVPKNWGNTIQFTFTQGGEKSLGELMTGPGGLGIILGKGLKGDYLWDRNACGDIPVFLNPESIGLYQVEKALAPSVASIYDQSDTPKQAREALSFIPVNQFDGDYQGWINMGMACHAAGLDCEDWDNWSRGSKSYSSSKDCSNHWKSFKGGGGITAATLFKFAIDNGYKPPRQQQQTPVINTSKPNYQTSGNAASKPEQKQKKATEGEVREALKKVENILLDFDIDEISKEIKINQIREELNIDWKLWSTLRSKVNKEIRAKQLESELRSLSLIDDKIKLAQGIHDLSEKYRMSLGSLYTLLKELKARNITPQFESMGLDDLFDEVSDAIDYLIPGLLPKGESAILCASPKVGKSLLSIDLAFAVATGEDYFLGETCKQGKVLLVSVDESKQSVRAKLQKRGFRKQDAPNIRLITQFCVSQLEKLEAEIEDFRPTLVIIDSLKRITKGSEISENSAEFSDNIYTISELCNRYGASCVLIHHSKKDNETIGVDNVRGSSAITGALGNTWIMNRVATPDPENKKKFIFDPKDPRRQLYCYSRDSEGKAFNLEFNPDNNSWAVTGEMGVSEEDAQQQKTAKERILSVLRANLPKHPDGMSSGDIFDCLDLGESMPKGTFSSALYRLVSDRIIGMAPSRTARYSLYFLPGYGYGQSEPNQNTTNQPDSKPKTNEFENIKKTHIPPHPPLYVPEKELNTTTTMDVEFQELSFHFHSTFIPLSSNSENTTHVSDCNIGLEAVSGATYTELSSFPEQGGGGCAPKFEADPIEEKFRTTNAPDTTISDNPPLPTPTPEPLPPDYRPTLQELTSAPPLPSLTHVACVGYVDEDEQMLSDLWYIIADLKSDEISDDDKLDYLNSIRRTPEEREQLRNLSPKIIERYPDDFQLLMDFCKAHPYVETKEIA